ncbi:alpha/beta hydrolase [Profundibacter sp.]
MIRKLKSTRRAAASGKPTSLMVFLHGYGADGDDLMGLASQMAAYFPDTVFVAPDAPQTCAGNAAGFQWFSVPQVDGASEEDAVEGMMQSARDLDAFLDQVMEQEGVSADKCVIFGFSQGTMMALQVAPRRQQPLAAVVGFSGSLMLPDALRDEVVSRPPVMLLHGDKDEVVPPEALSKAEFALDALGFEVYAFVMENAAHGIASDGLSVASGFLREKLGIEE